MDLDSGWQMQDVAKVPEKGAEISRPDYQPHSWYSATVPGTVLTTLVNQRVYPEPMFGENNRPDRIPESLTRTSYWYRTTFNVPTSFSGRHTWIHFDGINYAAEVWINGRMAGSIKGAFLRGTFDISSDVVPGKPAVVAVLISPGPNPGIPHEHTMAQGMGKNGGVTSQDGPTFLSTIGWDWLPAIRDRDIGIWQKVWISESGSVLIKDPQVTTDVALPSRASADITIGMTLQNISDQPQKGELTLNCEGISLRAPFDIKANSAQRITFRPEAAHELHVTNPRLWWPNGYGPQNLYHLSLSATIDGATSDRQELNFGIRKISYVDPVSDNLTISVNGVKIFIKGGNWGLDEAMKRIPVERLEAEIRMHRDAHLNLIRNWVGQSSSEAFYELCDKYGLLIWDEFIQPNPSDGPNPDDLQTYLCNVRDKILRYRNHPSIALWCGRNEGAPPPEIDKAIQALTSKLDPDRLYQPSSTSGHGVHSSGPYGWRTATQFYSYTEAFKTEIGAVSIPTIESIHGMLDEKDWETIDDAWAEHDFASGASGGDDYRGTIEHRYGSIANLADFVRKAQLANYEAYRAMFEGRQAKLFSPSTGAIIWMSNPAQPSFVWQLYHHDLEPNAAFFAVEKSAEPVHVQLNELTGEIEVINHHPEPLEGTSVQAVLVDLSGAEVGRTSYPVTAAPSSMTAVAQLEPPANVSKIYFVKLTLFDAGKSELSSNFYWRTNPKPDDLLVDLEKLAKMPVQVSARYDSATNASSEGGVRLRVTLHNDGKQVALMTHMQLRDAKSMQRILPVYYSDNYISLLPGETRQIGIEAPSAAVKGGTPAILLDGWNLSLVADKSSQIAIDANVDAQPEHWPVTHLPINWGKPMDHYRLHCGGDQVGAFDADNDHFIGRPTIPWTGPIDVRAAFAAPEEIYRTRRIGSVRYRFPMMQNQENSSYEVRLHFVEATFNEAGRRKFDVYLNDTKVLSDLDVYQEAGGEHRALVKVFKGITPDKEGNISVHLGTGSKDQPEISGIELLPSSGQP
jgi:beta-mannosidase